MTTELNMDSFHDGAWKKLCQWYYVTNASLLHFWEDNYTIYAVVSWQTKIDFVRLFPIGNDWQLSVDSSINK